MTINKFEEIECWRSALLITKKIYDLTSNPKFSRDWFLKDQVRRSIVSVSSNIVEGFERQNNNEFIRFLKIAKGSAGEARNQIYIAKIVDYISEEETKDIVKELENLSKQIGSFINYLEGSRKLSKLSKPSKLVNK